jgi:hypothetical protein
LILGGFNGLEGLTKKPAGVTLGQQPISSLQHSYQLLPGNSFRHNRDRHPPPQTLLLSDNWYVFDFLVLSKLGLFNFGLGPNYLILERRIVTLYK